MLRMWPHTMTRNFLLPLLLMTVLSANKCNEDKTAMGAMATDALMNSTWVLQTLGGKAVAMPEGVDTPWIKLSADGDRLEGFGGCNNMFGGFQIEGSKISFPGLGGTKKYCEATQQTENAFMGALRETDAFKLDKGVLSLLQGTRELATLKAPAP